MILRSFMVWVARMLTACELIKYGLSHATVLPQITTEIAPTNPDLWITALMETTGKTSVSQMTTASRALPPADDFLTKWTAFLTFTEPPVTGIDNPKTKFQTRPTNVMENKSYGKSDWTPDYKIIHLRQTTVSPNPESMSTDGDDNTKTGTWSGEMTTGYKTDGSTSKVEIGHTTVLNYWGMQTNMEISTSPQRDSFMQATSWSNQETDGGTEFVTTTLSDNTEKEHELGTHRPTFNSTITYVHETQPTTHSLNSEGNTTEYFNTMPTAVNITTAKSSDDKDFSTESLKEYSLSTNSVSSAFLEFQTASEEWTTEYQDTTPATLENITNSEDNRTSTQAAYTQRHSSNAWSTSSLITSVEATNTSSSTNVSGPHGGDTLTVTWLNCFGKDSKSLTNRRSKMVCLITMWSLGMTASVFLGITIFLWARLSILRKRAKQKKWGRKNSGKQGSTPKERESLWASHDTTTEERVEFWYANGSTLEADRKAKEREREDRIKRKSEKDKGKEEDMWMQPRVTMEDIVGFWYSNGRHRYMESTEV